MWNCRNVKKSCMCAERRRKKRKEILLPCQQVSTKPGTARKERGRRARGRKTERRLDTNLLKISIRRIRWNISVKRDGFWSRTEPAGSSAMCYLVSSIQKNLHNEKEKVFRRFYIIRIINFVSSSESLCVWRAFFFFSSKVCSSFRFLRLRQTEHFWIFFVFEGHIFLVYATLSLIHFFSVNVYFYFYPKWWLKYYFGSRNPKLAPACVVFFLVLFDNNILTSASLWFTLQFVIYLPSGDQSREDVGHDMLETRIWWKREKEPQWLGVETLIDFQL